MSVAFYNKQILRNVLRFASAARKFGRYVNSEISDEYRLFKN